jgi:hypothetical protein
MGKMRRRKPIEAVMPPCRRIPSLPRKLDKLDNSISWHQGEIFIYKTIHFSQGVSFVLQPRSLQSFLAFRSFYPTFQTHILLQLRCYTYYCLYISLPLSDSKQQPNSKHAFLIHHPFTLPPRPCGLLSHAKEEACFLNYLRRRCSRN